MTWRHAQLSNRVTSRDRIVSVLLPLWKSPALLTEAIWDHGLHSRSVSKDSPLRIRSSQGGTSSPHFSPGSSVTQVISTHAIVWTFHLLCVCCL